MWKDWLMKVRILLSCKELLESIETLTREVRNMAHTVQEVKDLANEIDAKTKAQTESLTQVLTIVTDLKAVGSGATSDDIDQIFKALTETKENTDAIGETVTKILNPPVTVVEVPHVAEIPVFSSGSTIPTFVGDGVNEANIVRDHG